MTRHLTSYIFLLTSSVIFVACSMTKNIPDGDQLFTGLKDITYEDYERNDNFVKTQEEVEASLATAPNGSLFGSSYYRMPFSFGVSVWNTYSEKDTPFARWMTKAFGKQPVLMSWVNPELRANVAQSVLRNHGYFGSQVDFETITQKNPKTAKISYHVRPGRMYTLDSISIVGFPPAADSLIQATADERRVLPLWSAISMPSVSVSVHCCVTMVITITSLAMLLIWPTPLWLTARCSCS